MAIALHETKTFASTGLISSGSVTFTIDPTTDPGCLVTIGLRSHTVTVSGISLGTATFAQVSRLAGTDIAVEHWYSGDADGHSSPLVVSLSGGATRMVFGATMIAGMLAGGTPQDVGQSAQGNSPSQPIDTGTTASTTTKTQLWVATAAIKGIAGVGIPTMSAPTDGFAQLFQVPTDGGAAPYGAKMRVGTWWKIVAAIGTAHLGLSDDVAPNSADWVALVETYKGVEPSLAGGGPQGPPPPWLLDEDLAREFL